LIALLLASSVHAAWAKKVTGTHVKKGSSTSSPHNRSTEELRSFVEHRLYFFNMMDPKRNLLTDLFLKFVRPDYELPPNSAETLENFGFLGHKGELKSEMIDLLAPHFTRME